MSVQAPSRLSTERQRVRVRGTVQGVGFRPFVWRLASELGLDGWVRNDAEGVLAEVQSAPLALEEFLRRVASGAPPLARVTAHSRRPFGLNRDLLDRLLPLAVPREIGDVGKDILR